MLKKNFIRGRMNKDSDERMLPDGEARDFLNCRVNNSEGSDVGAIENCLGNEKLTTIGLTNAKVIGGTKDSFNEKLYWFVTSDEKDLVLEYDVNLENSLNVLLESSNPGGVLNFSNDFLITGVDKVVNENPSKDLLYWTDNLNPPRVINIERFKTISADSFTEEDISVIKKPPLFAPNFTFSSSIESSIDSMEDKFFAFAYRNKYIDGEYSALSSFTEYAFAPDKLNIDLSTLENKGMRNIFNALNITINSGGVNVVEVQLVLKESNSNTVYIVESFNKESENISNDFDIEYLFVNDKTLIALPEKELFRTYDNVPRLALAQEYANNRIIYGNYVEGFDIVDSNGDEIDIKYNLSINSSSLNDIDLVSSVTNSGNNFEINFSNLDLSKDTRINFFLNLNGTSPNTPATSSQSYSFILEQDYSSVLELTSSTVFENFVNVIMTNAFNNSNNSVPPEGGVIDSSTGFTFTIISNSISLSTPSTVYKIDNTPLDDLDNDFTFVTYNWEFIDISRVSFNLEKSSSSLKTNRNLEAGLIYLDDYGRRTTVLLSKTNTIDIPQSLSDSQNKLVVSIESKPPVDAKYYKLAIKQNKGFYENIFCPTFFEEDQFIWIKLEEYNIDKINKGDVLYVKRDSSGVLNDSVKVTVLEVTTQSKNFIDNNFFNLATGEIAISDDQDDNIIELIEPQGTYFKIKPIGFNMNYNANTFFEKNYGNNSDDAYRFPSVVVSGLRNDTDYFPINTGSIVNISIRNDVERTSPYDVATTLRTYTSSADYTSFRDFFIQEVGIVPITPDVYNSQGNFLDFQYRDVFEVIDNGAEGIRIEGVFSGRGKRSTSRFDVDISIRNSNGLVVFETVPSNNISEIYYETSETFRIENGFHLGKEQDQSETEDFAVSTLDFFNCYSMGEGVESISYLDGFNKPYLNIDLRPTSTSIERFRRVRRLSDLTYSEPYVENTNYNGLSEFNLAKANYKEDIDKRYGSIQFIFAKDTDLLVYQEDKISKVLYGKDLLLNADGTSNVTSIENVLGQQVPYTGEYGISRSPESFAFFGNRIYSVDPKRGTPLRLSVDGVNEINYGLLDFFKDAFRENTYEVFQAEYDPYFDEYLVVIKSKGETFTIGFQESGYSSQNKGWTSRYSFVPEKMMGMNNQLYSFKNGELYIHNSENVPKNNFYGVQYNSKVTTIINQGSQDDKIFKTLVLEGNKPWSAKLTTNYTESTIKKSEFNNRESRWFSYIRKNESINDLRGNASQGIGVIQSFTGANVTFNSISSIASIGDVLYSLDGSISNIVGTISEINGNTIVLEGLLNEPVVGQYSYVKKSSRIEGSETRGYYLEVELENDDTDDVELFAVSSNAVKSFM